MLRIQVRGGALEKNVAVVVNSGYIFLGQSQQDLLTD